MDERQATARDLAIELLDYYETNRDYKDMYYLLKDIMDTCLCYLEPELKEKYLEELES